MRCELLETPRPHSPLLMLLDGEQDELCLAGDRLDVVFRLLLGLEPEPPEIDDSRNGNTGMRLLNTVRKRFVNAHRSPCTGTNPGREGREEGTTRRACEPRRAPSLLPHGGAQTAHPPALDSSSEFAACNLPVFSLELFVARMSWPMPCSPPPPPPPLLLPPPLCTIKWLCSPSPSDESSEESPVNGTDRIWLARWKVTSKLKHIIINL